MQPRTLYTSLLLMIIIGSALGHGEEFKEKPLKRHMRESANIRALIAKGLRRFKVADDENIVNSWDVALSLLSDLFPDKEIFKGLRPTWQLSQLCNFLVGYVKMMPVENLQDMHIKFLKLQHDVKKQLGVIL